MQIEFNFGHEIAITPAIAADLWPEIVALDQNPVDAAEDGEAIFQVEARFSGDTFDDDAQWFEADRLTVDEKTCPPDLVIFFEAQLRKQGEDALNEYIRNYRFYDGMSDRERWRTVWMNASTMSRAAARARGAA